MEVKQAGYLFLITINLIFQLVESATYRWNFGSDEPGRFLIDQKIGIIGIFDKIIDIPLNVPPCTAIAQVTVLVNNFVNVPEVTFDSLSATVSINYSLHQSSYSSYKVEVYALNPPNCISSGVGPYYEPPKQTMKAKLY